MTCVSIETALELWASSLPNAKARIDPELSGHPILGHSAGRHPVSVGRGGYLPLTVSSKISAVY